jgi:dipeptidase E
LVSGSRRAGVIPNALDFADDPNIVPEDYNPGIIRDGLSIIPYCIAPHYHSDHPDSERINQVIAYFIENKLLFTALRDGEIIIDDYHHFIVRSALIGAIDVY